MTPKQKALDAARKAYVLAAKRNDGPNDTVSAIIAAYEKEREAQRKAKRLPSGELLDNMPSFVRDLTRRVCARHDVEIEWVLGDAPLGQRYATAAARREIWTTLYGKPYGLGHISYPMIAGWFDRDHSSVMYAVKKTPRPSIKMDRLPKPPPHAAEAIRIVMRVRAENRRYNQRQKEKA